MTRSRRTIALCSTVLLAAISTSAHAQTLSVPADSPRWELQKGREATVTEYQGRKSILLDGGAAILKEFEMRDGVIDVDVATPATRGFFGFDIRIDKDQANYEEIYTSASTSRDCPTQCSTRRC